MPLCIDIKQLASPHAAVYSLRKIAPETIPHSITVEVHSGITEVKSVGSREMSPSTLLAFLSSPLIKSKPRRSSANFLVRSRE